MGNRLIYPIPKCSYQDNKEDPTLIYIPHVKGRSSTIPNSSSPELKEKENKKIPCRFIQCQAEASPYLMIYFHANSEDLGYDLSYLLSKFEERFGMNILCPEYPTYGIYKKKDDGLDMDQAIYEDAIKVMQYCNNTLKFEYKNIILVGRSLGTGIVARLASEFTVRGAIMISPFTSIRDVAKHLVGNLLSRLAPDVFKSIDYMDKLKSPVLFIHGKEDALIPCEMSVKLHEKVVVEIKEIVINEKMSHNQFKIEPDVFCPMSNFIQEKLDLGEHMLKVLDRYYDLYG